MILLNPTSQVLLTFLCTKV